MMLVPFWFLALYGLGFMEVDIVALKNKKILESELSKENVIEYKNINVYLTEEYLIARRYFYLHILKYSNLIWIYIRDDVDQYGQPDGGILFIGYNNKGEEYILTRIAKENLLSKLRKTQNELKKEELLDEVISKIKEKNPEVMIGFSIENREKYKEIVKEQKKKK